MRLADLYVLGGKPDEAKRLLTEASQKAPDYLPVWRRLAATSFQERNYDDTLKALAVLLNKQPSDIDGHLLLGRVRLAKRESTEAIQEFQQVLKLDARNALAHYLIGMAQLQAGNVQQAKAAMREATTIAPNFTEAVLGLAELNLRLLSRICG